MPRPKGTGGQAKTLSPAEIGRLNACLIGTRHESRNRALFFLGLGTGMRISEMVGLTLTDVLDANGQVLDHIVLEKHSTKNKKSRTVFISKQAQKLLQPHAQAVLAKRGRTAPLFSGQKQPRTPMHPNVATHLVETLLKRAAIVHASSHSMRRTHANTLRRNGADLMLIKEQLGHHSLQVTQRYFQVDPIEAATVVGKLKF